MEPLRNPGRFTPDSSVRLEEYRNDFVKAFCEIMQFWQRGMSIFLRGLDQLYREFDVYQRWPVWNWDTMTFPSVVDLLALFKSKDFSGGIKGHGRESLLSIIDKLEALIIELEPIVSCQRGFDIRKLYHDRRGLNLVLDGLSVEYQNFLVVCLIIQYSHLFKAHGPRGTLNLLLMFDEAKGICGKANERMFIVKDLFSKGSCLAKPL